MDSEEISKDALHLHFLTELFFIISISMIIICSIFNAATVPIFWEFHQSKWFVIYTNKVGRMNSESTGCVIS